MSKEHDQLIEREARRGRSFSIADRVGKEGAGFIKGESPVPRLQQVQAELSLFVADHLNDNSGALRSVLTRHIMTSDTTIAEHFGSPHEALGIIIDSILSSDARYHDFVQEVDIEWGRLMLEPPYFQEPGEEPHEDDEYTHESVRKDLLALRTML